jgi:hypothetical protein
MYISVVYIKVVYIKTEVDVSSRETSAMNFGDLASERGYTHAA